MNYPIKRKFNPNPLISRTSFMAIFNNPELHAIYLKVFQQEITSKVLSSHGWKQQAMRFVRQANRKRARVLKQAKKTIRRAKI